LNGKPNVLGGFLETIPMGVADFGYSGEGIPALLQQLSTSEAIRGRFMRFSVPHDRTGLGSPRSA